MSGQRYTPEFKDEAVKLVLERGYSAADVSNRLGVSQHSIYKWIKVSQLHALGFHFPDIVDAFGNRKF